MKLLFYFLSVLILSTNLLNAQNQWIKVSENTNYNLNTICLDSVNCLSIYHISGISCRLYHSSNGGFDWKIIIHEDDTFGYIPNDVAYPAIGHIYVFYNDNIIIKYNEFGKAWDTIRIDLKYKPLSGQVGQRKIKMIDKFIGILCVGNTLVTTKDGWKNYEIIRPDSNDSSLNYAVEMIDRNIFCCYSENQNYYYTFNSGKTFNKISFDYPFSDIFFLNEKIGYLKGWLNLTQTPITGKEILYKTNDSGISWIKLLDTIVDKYYYGSNHFEMINENVGAFVSRFGVVVSTTDGFKTFKREYIEGVNNTTSRMALAYSGSRLIVSTSGKGIFTQFDTIYNIMPKPELIEPPDKSITMTTDIKFKWKNSVGINKYIFLMSSNSEFLDTLNLDTLDYNPLQTEFQEFELKDFVACTDYFWRIGNLKEGRVKWSVPFSFNTGKIPVSLLYPENNSTEILQDVVVNWNKLNGSERYHLQCSFDDKFNDLFFSQDTLTKTFHKMDKLNEDTDIYWRVRGNCPNGFSNWSEIWKFHTKKSTGVANNTINENILVNPNPASDYIEISIPELNKGLQLLVQKVQIFNTLGIEVGQSSLIDDKNRIDISNLSVGVYFVRIGDKVEKFVKM